MHPALFSRSLHTSAPHWIHSPPQELYQHGEVTCGIKYQQVYPPIACKVKLLDRNNELLVELEHPCRAIAPGQYAVFYVNDEMIGSAQIIQSGPSATEMEQEQEKHSFKIRELSGPFGLVQ